jgi:hypothetical protein
MRPDWQSKGITRALLAQLHADPTLHPLHVGVERAPRAVSRYVRAGMIPRYPMYELVSSTRTSRTPHNVIHGYAMTSTNGSL